MTALLLFPVYFLRFWYVSAPIGIIKYLLSVNEAYFEMFSVFLLLKTFFKPLKNEYRKGLVGFSRGMGMAVKTVIILIAILLFLPLLIIEIALLLFFLAFPIITILLLFYNL